MDFARLRKSTQSSHLSALALLLMTDQRQTNHQACNDLGRSPNVILETENLVTTLSQLTPMSLLSDPNSFGMEDTLRWYRM